ncbi:MAG: hypothetical protein WBF05_10185, partial [Anaerolineales bacterium]
MDLLVVLGMEINSAHILLYKKNNSLTQYNSNPILSDVLLINWKEPTAEANLIKIKTTQFAGYE